VEVKEICGSLSIKLALLLPLENKCQVTSVVMLEENTIATENTVLTLRAFQKKMI